MRKFRRLAGAGFAALALMLVAASCGDDDSVEPTGGGSDVTGSLNISGSSTVEPITSLVAERFRGLNPGVSEIAVAAPGTSDGFALFCDGETDVQDASRPIDEEEVAACEKGGVEYIELEIALDGLSVVGNPQNAIDVPELRRPLRAVRSRVRRVRDLGGRERPRGRGRRQRGFPDAPLTIVAPGDESGTYGAFIDLAIGDIAEERGEPDDVLRKDYQVSADDNVIIDNAANNASGLGFVGLAFAENAGDTVKEFEVDGGEGCVAPSSETVVDGSYPLSRSLYLYVNLEKVSSNPALAALHRLLPLRRGHRRRGRGASTSRCRTTGWPRRGTRGTAGTPDRPDRRAGRAPAPGPSVGRCPMVGSDRVDAEGRLRWRARVRSRARST